MSTRRIYALMGILVTTLCLTGCYGNGVQTYETKPILNPKNYSEPKVEIDPEEASDIYEEEYKV